MTAEAYLRRSEEARILAEIVILWLTENIDDTVMANNVYDYVCIDALPDDLPERFLRRMEEWDARK
jgi:hypothetical protein